MIKKLNFFLLALVFCTSAQNISQLITKSLMNQNFQQQNQSNAGDDEGCANINSPPSGRLGGDEQQLNDESSNTQQHIIQVLSGNVQCNLTNYFVYQGNCISKSCLNNKLSRIGLTPQDSITGNQGVFNLGITYTAKAVQDTYGKSAYEVLISYQDQKNNQIVSDESCVQYRVYQTNNKFDIDNTRKWVYIQSGAPSWPISYYQYNDQLNVSQIRFLVSQQDLDTRQCIKFSSSDEISWQCFFELAFNLQNITQVSYYLCIKICINPNLQAGLPSVSFLKIIQFEQCPPNGRCAVSVTVDSSLHFCSNSTCEILATTPFFSLYLNRPYWLKYKIDNTAFSSWYINNMDVDYQASGFNLRLSPSEYDVINHSPGYNIIQLRVPIVSNQVLVTVSGQLSKTNTRILDSSQNQSIVINSSSTLPPKTQQVTHSQIGPIQTITPSPSQMSQIEEMVSKISSGYRILTAIIVVLIPLYF